VDANGVILEPGGPSVTLSPDLDPGDVDGSGVVDVGDAVTLLKALAGRTAPQETSSPRRMPTATDAWDWKRSCSFFRKFRN
jgi:hypothetical protein